MGIGITSSLGILFHSSQAVTWVPDQLGCHPVDGIIDPININHWSGYVDVIIFFTLQLGFACNSEPTTCS